MVPYVSGHRDAAAPDPGDRDAEAHMAHCPPCAPGARCLPYLPHLCGEPDRLQSWTGGPKEQICDERPHGASQAPRRACPFTGSVA